MSPVKWTYIYYIIIKCDMEAVKGFLRSVGNTASNARHISRGRMKQGHVPCRAAELGGADVKGFAELFAQVKRIIKPQFLGNLANAQVRALSIDWWTTPSTRHKIRSSLTCVLSSDWI